MLIAHSVDALLLLPAPAYVLPPDKLAKAIALNHEETILGLITLFWGILMPLLLLQLGVAARFSGFAARLTAKPWRQGCIFIPLLLLLNSVLKFPLTLAGHRIALAFGLSVQHWAGWFGDYGKSLLITLAAGTVVISILFAIVRHAPSLWWFWFWLISIPLTLGSVYLVPIVIDPIFNHYQPLQQSNPALVEQLERVVARSGIAIPPSRMFLMKASEKVTTANAYVTGFGGSKRVLVWDTTIHSATPDGILFIFGHELGHYVLGHVLLGTVLGILGTLIMLWLVYHLATWLIHKCGAHWGVPGMADWGAIVVLLLAAELLSFVSSPVDNGVSRHFEHQADVYGQEAIHGIVADPQQTAQQSFQQLGEESLDLPNPNQLIVFWDYSHPTTLDRATFARDYNPWVNGRHPQYVH